MKKILAAAAVAALVGAAGTANAADMYAPAGLKDTPYVAAPTWTGFYLGAHVGGAWSELKNNYNYNQVDVYGSGTWGYADGWKNTDSGVFGGGTVGYNWQTGAFVLGFEADFGGMGFSGNHTFYNAGGYDTYTTKDDSAFYADVTGRLGYAAGPALFYVKGGWAYLGTGNKFASTNVSGAAWNDGSLDGWTIGGGIEYMWSPSWSVKAEYLYMDFGKVSHGLSGTDGSANCDCHYFNWTDHQDSTLAINTFKVGLNYHFNTAYTPLK